MKIIQTILAAAMLAGTAMGADFTGTDNFGTTWKLSDLLAQGKHVVLMQTWSQ